jgi:hypothetical protein
MINVICIASCVIAYISILVLAGWLAYLSHTDSQR